MPVATTLDVSRGSRPAPQPAGALGFTLVELLVTIAIIAILVALLLPVLSSARLRTQQVHCLNNLRQLGLTALLYANEDQKYPAWSDSGFSGGGFWMGTLNVGARQKGITLCPSAPLRDPVPGQGWAQGTADRAWVRWTDDNRSGYFGSYGFNNWLRASGWWARDRPEFLFKTHANIQNPAATPLIADENWAGAGPLEDDPPCHDLYAGTYFSYPRGTATHLGRFTIARHGGVRPASAPRSLPPGSKLPGAINVVSADGHTQLVPLERLWTLYWHLDWQVPAVRPP